MQNDELDIALRSLRARFPEGMVSVTAIRDWYADGSLATSFHATLSAVPGCNESVCGIGVTLAAAMADLDVEMAKRQAAAAVAVRCCPSCGGTGKCHE